MGGVWESGVKLTKEILKKNLQHRVFHYEEFSTLVYSIASMNNSRPLAPLYDDPHDFRAITPSHLLMGYGILSIPEPNLEPLKLNTLDRFQLVTRILQEHWNSWNKDYLLKLQSKPKWVKVEKEFWIGELVQLMHENMPPNQWKLARITEVKKSKDGHIRTVTLETEGKYLPNGKKKIKTFTRPITSICHLPYIYDEERVIKIDEQEIENSEENNIENKI